MTSRVPVTLSPLTSELLFVTILGYVFLSEQPTLAEAIGGVMVFIAAIVSGLTIKKKKHKQPSG